MPGEGSSFSTPTIRLSRFAPGARLFAKLEHLQPTGSIYDRIAAPVLRVVCGSDNRKGTAQRRSIVVGGSGSFCLAFAAAHASSDLGELVLVAPHSTVAEHKELMRAHGANILWSESSDGLQGAWISARAEAATKGAVPVTPLDIADETERIFEQTVGSELSNALSAGEHAEVLIVAPFDAAYLLSALVRALPAELNARGLGSVRSCRETSCGQDGVIVETEAAGSSKIALVPVSDRTALRARAELARSEGLLVGPASAGALEIAREQANLAPARTVIAITIDAGDRYFSVDQDLAKETSVKDAPRGER
jgi:cysteine synthase A